MTARRIWLWPIALLIGFPVGGYVADLVVDGVDSVGDAIVAGLIAGAVIGTAEWFVLRRWVSWLWIPATTAGMAVGLAAGAALVDYGVDRGDLALMGAVTGVGVGVLQTLVLAGHQIPGCMVVGSRQPAWLGAGMDRELVCDCEKHRRSVAELRREWSARLRTSHLAASRNALTTNSTRSRADHPSRPVNIEAVAAVFLIFVPLAFNAFFLLLGRLFDYPNILRRSTEDILKASKQEGSA